MSRPGRRRSDPHDIEGGDKGMVIGMDLYGPLPPDVDGNCWALIMVEVSRTDYSIVVPMREKTAANVQQALSMAFEELKTVGKLGTPEVVRVHSDNDRSLLEGAVESFLKGRDIRQTHTGGYRPQNNARAERRIRMLNEGFRATLLHATGGVDVYDNLWAQGLIHASDRSN